MAEYEDVSLSHPSDIEDPRYRVYERVGYLQAVLLQLMPGNDEAQQWAVRYASRYFEDLPEEFVKGTVRVIRGDAND